MQPDTHPWGPLKQKYNFDDLPHGGFIKLVRRYDSMYGMEIIDEDMEDHFPTFAFTIDAIIRFDNIYRSYDVEASTQQEAEEIAVENAENEFPDASDIACDVRHKLIER